MFSEGHQTDGGVTGFDVAYPTEYLESMAATGVTSRIIATCDALWRRVVQVPCLLTKEIAVEALFIRSSQHKAIPLERSFIASHASDPHPSGVTYSPLTAESLSSLAPL